MNNFGYTKEVNTSFEEAINNLHNALAKEGFGVLTQIDMQEKLKEKINVDIQKYLILGACNPLLANEALQGEYEIGLFLPCNVIVYSKSGKIYVSAIKPTIAMGVIKNDIITSVAQKAETKLKKVIDSI